MSTAKTAAKSPAKTASKPKEPAAVKPQDNAFAGASDALGLGIDALFGSAEDPEFLVNLDDIEVVAQVREEMENEDQDLAGLAESLAQYQIQAIFLRIMPAGHPKPYRLVAGERRYRAARLKGMDQLRAKARELSDDEAEDLQFAENVHRKNLTQIEEAKKVQRDLDRLGSVEAVLAKHNKSRSWLSKVLSLASLPAQAARVVAENISADVEVINTVKTIEKADPKAAKELVEDLKATRGKANAREKANAVKEKVKPSKKDKPAKKDTGGSVATPKDRSQEEPGPAAVFAGAKTDQAGAAGDAANDPGAEDQGGPRPPAFPPAEILSRAYSNIFEFGSSPKTILDVMSAEEMEAIEGWLRPYYDAGVKTKGIGRAVMLGIRNGQFATDGEGAFALLAFLQGAESDTKFNLLDVFGCVKA